MWDKNNKKICTTLMFNFSLVILHYYHSFQKNIFICKSNSYFVHRNLKLFLTAQKPLCQSNIKLRNSQS